MSLLNSINRSLLVWMLGTTTAFAQLSFDDTLRFGYIVDYTAEFNQGNTNFSYHNLSCEFYARSKVLGFRTTNRYVYSGGDGDIYKRDCWTDIFIHLRPQRRIQPILMLTVETSYQQQISQGLLFGTGLNGFLVNKPDHKLSLFVVGAYDRYTYTRTDFERMPRHINGNTIPAGRMLFGLSGISQFGNKRWALDHEIWYSPAFTDASYQRAYAEGRLIVGLFKWLAITTEFQYEFYNLHLQSVRRYDFVWTVGVQLGNTLSLLE